MYIVNINGGIKPCIFDTNDKGVFILHRTLSFLFFAISNMINLSAWYFNKCNAHVYDPLNYPYLLIIITNTNNNFDHEQSNIIGFI